MNAIMQLSVCAHNPLPLFWHATPGALLAIPRIDIKLITPAGTSPRHSHSLCTLSTLSQWTKAAADTELHARVISELDSLYESARRTRTLHADCCVHVSGIICVKANYKSPCVANIFRPFSRSGTAAPARQRDGKHTRGNN